MCMLLGGMSSNSNLMPIVNHPLITISHSLVEVWYRGGLVHISGTIEKRNKRRNKQSNHLCLYIYIIHV